MGVMAQLSRAAAGSALVGISRRPYHQHGMAVGSHPAAYPPPGPSCPHDSPRARSSATRGSRRAPRTKVGAYVALTKPRIIELLLVSTVPTMILADAGPPVARADPGHAGRRHPGRRRRQRHQHVRRPRHRPADAPHPAPPARHRRGHAAGGPDLRHRPRGRRLRRAVRCWSTCWRPCWPCRPPSSTSSCTRSGSSAPRPSNIVIGGAAGAVPVLVGWAAVTDSLGWAPVVLFAVIFFWTPPHFWALGHPLRRRLPGRRRADAAGGVLHRGHQPPDARLHGRAVAPVAGAGAGRPTGLDLRRGGRRARCRVRLVGASTCAGTRPRAGPWASSATPSPT